MTELADIVDSFIKFCKTPRMRYIVLPISWILMPLSKLVNRIPFFQLMNVTFEIEKLESQNRFKDARRLRHAWMEKSRYSQSEELWCSEAKDLLYNKKEYGSALNAFEKVIKINSCYNPIELYYGASCASLLLGNHNKAEKYYSIFNEWWIKFQKNPKLRNHIQHRYSDCKKWLEQHIRFSKHIES